MTSQTPRRGRPTAAQREERRQRMLDVALPVFLSHGYQRTTIDQLAQAAGVTKRTIYTDYGDKAGLFAAMVAGLAAAISHDSSADGESLITLATRIVHRIQSDELVGLHRLVIAEAGRFPELARAFYERADRRHIESLREHIVAEHGAAAGDLAEPLFSLLLGTSHRRRLLDVIPAPSQKEAKSLASAAMDRLGLG